MRRQRRGDGVLSGPYDGQSQRAMKLNPSPASVSAPMTL
jgi:hypothetical protein